MSIMYKNEWIDDIQGVGVGAGNGLERAGMRWLLFNLVWTKK